jgi:Tfp pilus assembly protein PilF
MFGAPAAFIVWGFTARAPSGAAAQRRRGAAAQGPARAADRVRAARDLLRVGHRGEARALLIRAVGEDPNHVPALLELARMAEREADWDGVRRWAGRALQAAPGTVEARMLEARAHLVEGRDDEAETSLRRGLGTTPASGDLARELARLLVRKGRTAAAVAALRTALAAGPSPLDRPKLQADLDALAAHR